MWHGCRRRKNPSVKCSSCHKLTDEKLVGPGWKGVTERQKPEWIMNFITNPDPMIDKDPKATGTIRNLFGSYAKSRI